MKQNFLIAVAIIGLTTTNAYAQPQKDDQATIKKVFIDVHYLPAGKVSFKDVAAAHEKDLATQSKYGVEFIKYWVDETKGVVYCLSSARDSSHVSKTHAEAHGLMPQEIFEVTSGEEVGPTGKGTYFIDVHSLGEAKVTAGEVAKAHEMDMAVQKKYGVNFINYWVDEKKGVVICLSQAKDSSKVIDTHKAAHGLIPTSIQAVKQGN